MVAQKAAPTDRIDIDHRERPEFYTFQFPRCTLQIPHTVPTWALMAVNEVLTDPEASWDRKDGETRAEYRERAKRAEHDFFEALADVVACATEPPTESIDTLITINEGVEMVRFLFDARDVNRPASETARSESPDGSKAPLAIVS